MRYKALKSFSGIVSMHEGDEQEISDKTVAEDLLNAGYIQPLKARTKAKNTSKEG
jgi:hypothetical protein